MLILEHRCMIRVRLSSDVAKEKSHFVVIKRSGRDKYSVLPPMHGLPKIGPPRTTCIYRNFLPWVVPRTIRTCMASIDVLSCHRCIVPPKSVPPDIASYIQKIFLPWWSSTMYGCRRSSPGPSATP